jgi:hypothetical protein
MSSAHETGLRFGILADSGCLQRWQLACVEQLTALHYATAAVLLVTDDARVSVAGGSQLFHWLWGNPAAGSQRYRVELTGRLAALPVIRTRTTRSTNGQSVVDAETIAAIQKCDLDFIICFAEEVTASVRLLVDRARYGVWAFAFGDWETFRGKPAGFWEIFEGASVTGAMLVRLTEDPDSVIVLRSGYLRTKRMSYRQNSEHVLSRCTHWPAQACHDIRQSTRDTGRVPAPATLHSTARWRSPPNALQILVFAGKILAFAVAGGWRSLLRHDQWNVGIVPQPIQDFLDPARRRPDTHWLPARPRREFIADPFGLLRDNQLTILCEHLDYRSGRGVIVATTDPDGTAFVPVDIGPRPAVHLSYPFLFEADGHYYCVPESHEAGEVALYVAEQLPDKWIKVATLLENIAVVDSTLFRYGDHWWLAAADSGASAPSADLFLWYSTALTGPWKPHGGNPVKTDVRSARPGGTPFSVNGILYRPAMDCSETYGGQIVINRVLDLTPTTFSEEIATTVAPNPRSEYPDGLHTLSAVGNITLIDGKRSVFVPAELWRLLTRLIQALSNKGAHWLRSRRTQ